MAAGKRPAGEPANVGAALEKGHALEEAERWKDAELVYRETLKQPGVEGRDAARLHVRMAFLMSRAGRDENAVEHAAMARKFAPDWDDGEEVLAEMERRLAERRAGGKTAAAKGDKKRAAKAPLTEEQKARAAKKREAAAAEAEALRKKAGELKATAQRLELERNELRQRVKALELETAALRERIAAMEKELAERK